MKAKVITLDNKKSAETTLSKEVFGLEVRKDILHRVIRWQQAKRQAGTHKTKQLSEVSGTTKKPFNQKGTGNARAGSLRAPQMRGGATVFGPVSRSHAFDLPKKVRKLGLKVALSAKAAEGKLLVLEDTKATPKKTKEFTKQLEALGLTSALFIDETEQNKDLVKVANNVKHIDVLPQQGANVYDIVQHDTLIVTKAAIKQLEERLV